MDRALTWFIRLWIGAVLLLNIAAVVGMFAVAPSIGSALKRVTETYSPFNGANLVAEIVTLAPAIGAFYWRKKRRDAIASKAP